MRRERDRAKIKSTRMKTFSHILGVLIQASINEEGGGGPAARPPHFLFFLQKEPIWLAHHQYFWNTRALPQLRTSLVDMLLSPPPTTPPKNKKHALSCIYLFGPPAYPPFTWKLNLWWWPNNKKIWDENEVQLGTPLGTNTLGTWGGDPFGNLMETSWALEENNRVGTDSQKHKTPILSCSIVLGVIGTHLVRFCAFICCKILSSKFFRGLFWIFPDFFGGLKNLPKFWEIWVFVSLSSWKWIEQALIVFG